MHFHIKGVQLWVETVVLTKFFYTMQHKHSVVTPPYLVPWDVNLQEGSHRKQILPSNSLWLFLGL
jgi:hypothetical protein